MNLSIARGWVKQFGRNAGDSSMYSDGDIDRAIQSVCSRFCRETRAIQLVTDAFLAVDDTTFIVQYPSVTTGNPGIISIMPEQIMGLTLQDKGDKLTVIDASDLPAIRATNVGLEGESLGSTPAYASVLSNIGSIGTDGVVVDFWPAAGVAQDVFIKVWVAFTTWTPGISDAAAQAVQLNLPDHWLAQILPYGPTATLQHNEPEHKYASATWQRYLAVEQSFMGAGIMAKKVAIRRKRP